jgi:hypothetical protein
MSERPAAPQGLTLVPPFDAVIAQADDLLRETGAAVVQVNGQTHFVAVAMADSKGGRDEPVQRFRVARANALRAAAEFAEGNHVLVEERSSITTTIIRSGGRTSETVQESADQKIRVRVKAALRNLTDGGTWRSDDGSRYFFLVGCRLD